MSDLLINLLNFDKLSAVAILIMHGAGSPTSICIMRCYFKCTKPFCPREGPMHPEILCIMYYENFNGNGNTHFNINYDTIYFKVILLNIENMIEFMIYDRSAFIGNY